MDVVSPSTEIYQPSIENDDTDETFNFSTALEALKDGNSITRDDWVTGAFLELQEPDENSNMTKSCICIHLAGDIQPYTLTNDDILADDWIVL